MTSLRHLTYIHLVHQNQVFDYQRNRKMTSSANFIRQLKQHVKVSTCISVVTLLF